MTDYGTYQPDRKERAMYFAMAFLVSAGLALLFYRSLPFALPLAALSVSLEKVYLAARAKKRRMNLLEGFRDALYGISAAVAAGRQMPQAIEETARQSEIAYGPDADIARELRAIALAYRSMHQDALAMLTDLGRRSGLEEIAQFASSCSICTSCGGDLEDVCLRTAEVLLEKLSFRQEAESLLAQKRLDIALLVGLPLLMLAFLNLASPGYLSALYKGPAGRLLMTACLAAMGGAVLWSFHIVQENT
ncbi:MAG: type II secretion system F family protein [Clostridia bacterium]|nr:type II secretion system F family protein [Clostridia bacterium]